MKQSSPAGRRGLTVPLADEAGGGLKHGVTVGRAAAAVFPSLTKRGVG